MSRPRKSQRSGPPHHPQVRKLVEQQRLGSRNPSPDEQIAGFRGWNERGYLPHRDECGLIQFVTFRLADGFPTELRHEWEKLLQIEDALDRRAEIEGWYDRGLGECHLRDNRIARLTADALQHFHGIRYRLIAWVVMPNHVHVLFEVGPTPMAKIVRSWKQFTATKANKLLGRSGAFWQRDYWDTYIRDADHEGRAIRYIENNPIKAGLVKHSKDWPWGHWSYRP